MRDGREPTGARGRQRAARQRLDPTRKSFRAAVCLETLPARPGDTTRATQSVALVVVRQGPWLAGWRERPRGGNAGTSQEKKAPGSGLLGSVRAAVSLSLFHTHRDRAHEAAHGARLARRHGGAGGGEGLHRNGGRGGGEKEAKKRREWLTTSLRSAPFLFGFRAPLLLRDGLPTSVCAGTAHTHTLCASPRPSVHTPTPSRPHKLDSLPAPHDAPQARHPGPADGCSRQGELGVD